MNPEIHALALGFRRGTLIVEGLLQLNSLFSHGGLLREFRRIGGLRDHDE